MASAVRAGSAPGCTFWSRSIELCDPSADRLPVHSCSNIGQYGRQTYSNDFDYHAPATLTRNMSAQYCISSRRQRLPPLSPERAESYLNDEICHGIFMISSRIHKSCGTRHVSSSNSRGGLPLLHDRYQRNKRKCESKEQETFWQMHSGFILELWFTSRMTSRNHWTVYSRPWKCQRSGCRLLQHYNSILFSNVPIRTWTPILTAEALSWQYATWLNFALATCHRIKGQR